MSNVSNFFYRKERHGFHLVDNSQLPVMTSLSTFFLACSFVFYLNPTKSCILSVLDRVLMQVSVILLMAVLFSWFITVVIESGKGYHTEVVRRGLRLGMLLFIISEVMLFFSFFWAFFHVSLAPAITLGCVWPPATMQPLDVWGLPFFNTWILLTSGFFLTYAHQSLISEQNDETIWETMIWLYMTVFCALMFLGCQLGEYKYGINFSWSDNVFGSIFYITTGFHGLHVVIGMFFLIFCLVRLVITTLDVETLSAEYKSLARYLSIYSFRKEQHIGFEAAAWYWHFVDVVWIFLFLTIYWWNTEMSDISPFIENVTVAETTEISSDVFARVALKTTISN